MHGHIFFPVKKAHLSVSCITNNMSHKTGPSVILYHFKIFCQAYVSNMDFWLLVSSKKFVVKVLRVALK